MMKRRILTLVFALIALHLNGQNVGINNDGSTPESSAILDVKSIDKGLLIPRTDTTAVNASSPVAGLMIYQNLDNTFYYYDGAKWKEVGQDADASPTNELQTLSLNGNNLSISNGNGVTLTPAPDNDWTVSGSTIYRTSGAVGIGTTNPQALLHVNSTARMNSLITEYGAVVNNAAYGGGDLRVKSINLDRLLLVDASTNRVGIALPNGVTSPTSTLDVRGSARVGSSSNSNLLWVDTNTDRIGIGTSSLSSTLTVNGSALFNQTLGDNDFRVASDNQSSMLFVNGGTDKVGIGTSNPSYTLDIYGDARCTSLFRTTDLIADNGVLYVDGGTNRVGIGTTNPLTSFHVSGSSTFGATTHNSTATYNALVRNLSGGIISNDNGTSSGYFRAESNNNQNMLYVNAGTDRVGIGTNNPYQELHVVGDICYTGTSSSCSDIRYKQNFQPIEGALSKLLQLNGLYYEWNLEQYPAMNFGDQRQIGVIAQEVEQFFPEIVMTNDEGYKSVDYSLLTPILLEALKEQQEMIKGQENELSKLNAKVSRLQNQEDRLQKIEAQLSNLSSKKSQ